MRCLYEQFFARQIDAWNYLPVETHTVDSDACNTSEILLSSTYF